MFVSTEGAEGFGQEQKQGGELLRGTLEHMFRSGGVINPPVPTHTTL